jgi:hypothetical protein
VNYRIKLQTIAFGENPNLLQKYVKPLEIPIYAQFVYKLSLQKNSFEGFLCRKQNSVQRGYGEDLLIN